VLIHDHLAAWGENVQGLLIDASYGVAGLASCQAATGLPILQDNMSGDLWAALGNNGDLIVVDQNGVLAARLNPVSFPAIGTELVPLVDQLLGL